MEFSHIFQKGQLVEFLWVVAGKRTKIDGKIVEIRPNSVIVSFNYVLHREIDYSSMFKRPNNCKRYKEIYEKMCHNFGPNTRDFEIELYAFLNKDKSQRVNGPICPICRDSPNDPTKIDCGHVFCRNCINKLEKKDCPVCRKPFKNLCRLYY